MCDPRRKLQNSNPFNAIGIQTLIQRTAPQFYGSVEIVVEKDLSEIANHYNQKIAFSLKFVKGRSLIT